jgi:hypothetical protein
MNIKPEDLWNMDPQTLFINLTAAIYDARTRGAWHEIDAILSAFEPDARRALCIGAAALRIMPGTDAADYRRAIMASMAETLYNAMQEDE